jgi:uncharacterized protein YqgC (DUF456 family)
MSHDVQNAIAATIVIVASFAGVILTLLTLPGMWLSLVAGVAVALWRPDLLSWWSVGVAGGLAVLAEAIELIASAAGAKKGGASKHGAIGAVIGSFVGALVGSPFLFPIGTVVGGVAGAGLGAVIAERGFKGRSWGDSAKAGQGAAIGRLVATALKTLLALVMALVLSIAVLR